jgi:hypothetical protein
MSNEDTRIEHFLAKLKTDGRSSPSDWHQFYLFLKARTLSNQPPPPMPLILAASDESNASKHRRLGEQLEWAYVNQCLDEAIWYLKKLSAHQWNSCSIENWHKSGYPKM